MSEKKTIIVTEAGGRERHYDASDWRHDGDRLEIITTDPDTSETIGIAAEYAPGAWNSVRDAGALVPDATVRVLTIAKQALRQIAQASEDETAAEILIRVARDAEEEIFAETEL